MTRGCYQLILHLDRKSRIKIGKKGEYDFPAGYYIYSGSALNGLEGRIKRHLRREKKNFWHIDYLLPYCKILKVVQYHQSDKSITTECKLNKKLLKKKNSVVVMKGFGSSDCRCPSHLVHFNNTVGAIHELPLQLHQRKCHAKESLLHRLKGSKVRLQIWSLRQVGKSTGKNQPGKLFFKG